MRKQFTRNSLILTFAGFFIFISNNLFSQNGGPLLTDTLHLQVNMSYMAANGTFDPSKDTVDVAGTMNNWNGDILQRVGSSLIYEFTYVLPIAAVYNYYFRIRNGDTITESADPMSRHIRIEDTTFTVTNYFSNYNPATVAMTFNCNMYYQIRAGHFSPATDFLDIAGNFNNEGEGAPDVLFSKTTDSIYALTMFFDTAMIGQSLTFRFRFNGNWETAELQGDTVRSYILSSSGNSFTCWYNDIDPAVPSLPFVYNVEIHDSLISKHNVTGAYSYEDYNLRPEGKSVYQWYLADSVGGALTPIDSAWSVNYKIDSLNIGKYLVFEVKPVTADSVVGLPVQAWSAYKIVGVGIDRKEMPGARIFPNPASDLMTMEFTEPVSRLEVFDVNGKMILSRNTVSSRRVWINVGGLVPGVYFLKTKFHGDISGTYRFIKK